MIKVSARDFGPIIEGSVSLKPLTIFVGPSNAGKSYLAMLVYSLMQATEPFPFGSFDGFTSHGILTSRRQAGRKMLLNLGSELEVDEGVAKAIDCWLGSIEANTSEISLLDLPEDVRSLVNRSVDSSLQTIGQLFGQELQRCHGEISAIRSRRSSDACLKVGLEQKEPLLKLNFEEEGDSLRASSGREWDISRWSFEIPRGLLSFLQTEVSTRSPRSGDVLGPHHYSFLALLAQSAPAKLFENFPTSCYYLPAARSGIAQGHKAIASMLVRQSSFAAIRPFEIPTLSGIITDFMGHILTMERAGDWGHESDMEGMEDVVDFLERRVVGGRIDIERSGEVTYPEISYAPTAGPPGVGKFPFHRTSSMVSELAPVVLFLKYLVRPRDLVVLEEPESHLHPASQRQMARAIARLVNAGVKVIITTHSDYFIGQVNNLLKLSSASRQKRTKEGYDAVDCLKPDDVGAYHFQMDDRVGGSLVKELPIIPGFGIDEQEFAAVSEALYEETVSFQRIRGSR